MSETSDDTGFAPPGATSAAATPATSPAEGSDRTEVRRAARQPAPTRKRGKRPKPRQTRVVLRKLGPWSVFKVSLFFYTCIIAVFLLATAILYAILGAVGSLAAVTRLAQDLFGDETFRIHGGWIFARLVVTGAVMVFVWSLINVFVAFLYNLISDVIGGVEVTLGERR
jgi:hypothetical protein